MSYNEIDTHLLLLPVPLIPAFEFNILIITESVQSSIETVRRDTALTATSGKLECCLRVLHLFEVVYGMQMID